MRLLADENVHADLIEWLRFQGHDVCSISDTMPAITDPTVLSLAVQADRVLLTDDKDFGELVFSQRLPAIGILLVRLSSPRLSDRIARLATLWPQVEANAVGNLIVISDDKMRVRPLPQRNAKQ